MPVPYPARPASPMVLHDQCPWDLEQAELVRVGTSRTTSSGGVAIFPSRRLRSFPGRRDTTGIATAAAVDGAVGVAFR